MDAIIIEPKKLAGSVTISGSKNASLPIICASLLIDEAYLINVPKIKDIMLLIERGEDDGDYGGKNFIYNSYFRWYYYIFCY